MSVFDDRMGKARRRVASMDAVDGHKDRTLHCIRAALEAGLRRPETEAAYDALAMLEDEHECIRQEVRHEMQRAMHRGTV